MPAIKLRVSITGGQRSDTKIDVYSSALAERRIVLKNGAEITTSQAEKCIEDALKKLIAKNS